MKSFTELTLSPVLQANLLKHGYTQPTPVQELAIEPALAGRNVVATAQTGTGKTLAFVLPLVQSLMAERATKGVRAVILSPTRELAIQIHEAFGKIAHGTGIRAAIVGSVPGAGVTDVYVVINATGPTGRGCLDDYNPDLGDPGICTTTFDGGNNVSDSDIVQVSSSGDIAVTNSETSPIRSASVPDSGLQVSR